MNALVHLLNSPFSPADNFPFSLSITFSCFLVLLLQTDTHVRVRNPNNNNNNNPPESFRGKQGSNDMTSASVLTVHLSVE